MARTQDPHSATSQFFINVKDNDFLNHSGKNMQGWGYTVFGKVTSGMDVIEKKCAAYQLVVSACMLMCQKSQLLSTQQPSSLSNSHSIAAIQ